MRERDATLHNLRDSMNQSTYCRARHGSFAVNARTPACNKAAQAWKRAPRLSSAAQSLPERAGPIYPSRTLHELLTLLPIPPGMQNSRLPIELCELVIDLIPDPQPWWEFPRSWFGARPETLVKYTSVCSAWLPRARLVLYHSIRFRTPSQVDLFIRTITENPSLANMVRELVIKPKDGQTYIPNGFSLPVTMNWWPCSPSQILLSGATPTIIACGLECLGSFTRYAISRHYISMVLRHTASPVSTQRDDHRGYAQNSGHWCYT
ncbi:hypothetical protein C8T65DRAFT_234472 [Cerioporus squamosus]|nr:hypothetical protein C8T65DRAFT_234472 [Cerioporus squamosus]